MAFRWWEKYFAEGRKDPLLFRSQVWEALWIYKGLSWKTVTGNFCWIPVTAVFNFVLYKYLSNSLSPYSLWNSSEFSCHYISPFSLCYHVLCIFQTSNKKTWAYCFNTNCFHILKKEKIATLSRISPSY